MISGGNKMRLDSKQVIEKLSNPKKLFYYKDLDFVNNPPKEPGVYAFYFDQLPYDDIKGVGDCNKVGGWILMYVGISPEEGSISGNINERIKSHFGNVKSGLSTLRLTLGCLLMKSHTLDIKLKIKGVETFGVEGEQKLTEWMKEHAKVCWAVTERPWNVEVSVIQALRLPFNIKHNKDNHPFPGILSQIRSKYVNEAKKAKNAEKDQEVKASGETSKPEEEQLPSNVKKGVKGRKYGKNKDLYTVDEKDEGLIVFVHHENRSVIREIKNNMDNPSRFFTLWEPDKERYEHFRQGGYRATDQIGNRAKSYLGIIVLLDYPEYFKKGNVKFRFYPHQ